MAGIDGDSVDEKVLVAMCTDEEVMHSLKKLNTYFESKGMATESGRTMTIYANIHRVLLSKPKKKCSLLDCFPSK